MSDISSPTDESVRSHDTDTLSLEHLLSIWPIASTLACKLSVGDLISLSRTSSVARAHTHGFPLAHMSDEDTDDVASNTQYLFVGKHQTSQWSTLKSLAGFTCSSFSHRDPKSSGSTNNVVRPCKFCSRPVCKACLVRTFFADKSQSKNTFRYRARYLCSKCWESGNLRKDFRFPTENTSREHIWRGQSYGQRGVYCCCSVSEDNWLCKDCRTLQNVSGPDNNTLMDADRGLVEANQQHREVSKIDTAATEMKCYGLNCSDVIDDYNRDRRRICLWCSKGLARQFGGEDRLRWEEKQVEIRAARAAVRSADIAEYHRNRFRAFTMSRREMRGTTQCVLLTGRDGPEHDQPMFVRHLDATNYRKFLPDHVAPSPDDVYRSKNGRWRYSAAMMKSVNTWKLGKGLEPPVGVKPEDLFAVTGEGALTLARPNKAFLEVPRHPTKASCQLERTLFDISAQCYQASIMSIEEYSNVQRRVYQWPKKTLLERLLLDIQEDLKAWESGLDNGLASREPLRFSYLLIKSRAEIKSEDGSYRAVGPPADNNEVSEEDNDSTPTDTTVPETNTTHTSPKQDRPEEHEHLPAFYHMGEDPL